MPPSQNNQMSVFKNILRNLCDELFPIQYPDSWYDFVTSGFSGLRTVAIFHENVMIAIIICELKKRCQVNYVLYPQNCDCQRRSLNNQAFL